MQEKALKAARGKRHYVMRSNVIIDNFLLETWRPEEYGITFFKCLKKKRVNPEFYYPGKYFINQSFLDK